MATHLQRAASTDGSPDWRLTDGLNAKLTALTTLGLEVQWIEASRKDLTRLVVEGGEAAIRLDPDPSVDRAWFGDVEIRHCATRDDTWIFVKGEVASGEISAHQVTPPEG
jgi:hypothetical protein